MKNCCIGVLAHVDAGKTTLSESILYNTGAIRRAGRVDHGDSFLDTEKEERERGITIFSKQALFSLGEKQFTLIDTPGHVDFSAEMERALSVLDYAVLIISAPDGIHGHDITLWKLFKAYKLPVFIFVNKMDQTGADKDKVLGELKKKFGSSVIDMSAAIEPQAAEILHGAVADTGHTAGNAKPADKVTAVSDQTTSEKKSRRIISDSLCEEISLLDEGIMEDYLETGTLADDDVAGLIANRKLFPVCFGSALKNEGVDELLGLLNRFTCAKSYPDEFGAKVYKISRDAKGRRVAHIKITGGVLKPKDMVFVNGGHSTGKAAGLGADAAADADAHEEKVEQIFLYNGQSAEQLSEAYAGMAVAVTGLSQAVAGSTLGLERGGDEKILVPLFNSKITATFDTDMHKLYLRLKELEEEIPETELSYDSSKKEINARLMGEVQTEIIKSLVKERFGIDIGFTEGSIVYKETITQPVIGGGHYEPLKHYAEAHILIEPLERGSGIEIASDVRDEVLSKNFRRLIMTHLEEKKYRGVLMGAELTDVRFTVISGRSHEKHTEGGDFREATYRAVRQGLMRSMSNGACKILEPYYSFELIVPAASTGRAMTDLSQLAEDFSGPEISEDGEEAVFSGRAAVSRLRGYASEVMSYTGGFGRLNLSFGGYGDCIDTEKVLSENYYDPELDIDDPSGSVFCAHGAGYYVPWDEVDDMLHIDIREEEKRYIGARPENKLSDEERLRLLYGDSQGDYDAYGSNTYSGDGYGRSYATDGSNTEGGMQSGSIGAQDRKTYGSGQTSGTRGAASGKAGTAKNKKYDYLGAGLAGDKELESIWSSVSGRNVNAKKAEEKKNVQLMRESVQAGHGKDTVIMTAAPSVRIPDPKEQVLLVDGYNIIFAWEELKELSKVNIDSARAVLADMLSNYQGYRGMNLILVFDAYKVRNGQGSVEKYHNIYIVYTKEAQTADAYIEKTVHESGRKLRVTVATNDGMEQIIAFGGGAQRMSARELYEEVIKCNADIYEKYLKKPVKLENRMEIQG